jgi:hypothetical protein
MIIGGMGVAGVAEWLSGVSLGLLCGIGEDGVSIWSFVLVFEGGLWLCVTEIGSSS